MKKLLMIGAGFLQTFVIKRAKQLGYAVYALDGNPNAVGFEFCDRHECIDIVNKQACLEYARENRVDGVMTAATDFGVITASYIARELGLKGINYGAACLVKNKYEIKKRLFESGADDTDRSYEVDPDTDLRALADKIKYPVMVKPCDSSGSRGAGKVCVPEELDEACRFAMDNSLTHRAVVETFIDGREYGAESLVIDGKVHVMAVMKKWMTEPPYYAELGHAIPSGLPADTEKKIKTAVEDAIIALGIDFGSVNMDLLVTEAGSVHIVDIGARMGGNLIGSHIIPLGTGIDYIGNLIRATLGDPTDMTPSADRQIVVTRILALSPGRVAAMPDMKAIENRYGVEVCHHYAVGDEICEYHTNLDGCGYVVATAQTFDEAVRKADNALKAIDQETRRC